MTQEQLALALDVDPVTVSRFERGVTLPSLPTLHRMADIFGISLARLLEEAPQGKRGDAELLEALMILFPQQRKTLSWKRSNDFVR